MLLTFGKHHGMSVESLVLKEPDYAVWLLAQMGATTEIHTAKGEVGRLIQVYDEKPILESCRGCRNRATRCSLYFKSVRPRWWCDECDPDDGCPSTGKLRIIRTYLEAIHYVESYCGARQNDMRSLIKALAQAKGLSERVGEVDASAFFQLPRAKQNSPEFDAYWDELCG
jgi:hypothetical protein